MFFRSESDAGFAMLSRWLPVSTGDYAAVEPVMELRERADNAG